MTKITAREARAIDLLRKVATEWPDSIWLFSGSGQLCVMKKKDGQRVMTHLGGVDPDYALETIPIENDGGDW